MKVIIVGGTGLVGASAALRLRDEGHEVTLAGRNAPAPDSPIGGFAFQRFDFLADADRAPAILAEQHAMVFTAGQDPKTIPPDPAGPSAYLDRNSQSGQFLYRANALGVPRLFSAARDVGIEAAVNVGTFYPQVIPEVMATNSYMLSRKEADDGVCALATPGFRPMSVNPSWVMGAVPNMRFSLWENYLRYAAALDPSLPVFAPPGGVNIISLSLLVDAIVGALARGQGGKSYLLGDQNVTLQQFIGAFFEGFGREPPPIRNEPHPVMVDRAIQRGRNIWYEPDAADAALLGYRRNDGLRAIREEMVPAFKARIAEGSV